MSVVKISVAGNDSAGWTFGVTIDGLELFRTEPLMRDDLAAALFSIRRDDSRRNPFLGRLSDDELFFLLDGFFFGALHDAVRVSAEEQVWARHFVSLAVPVAVSSRMYLVGHDGDHERLIVWQNGQRWTFLLTEGSFDRELGSAIERLEV
jgi:hypothetical protein